MNNFSKITLSFALAGLIIPAANAKTTANDSLVNNFMRSSIYTVIVNSNVQNKRLDEETNNSANKDALLSMVKSFAGTDKKKAKNETESSLASLPVKEFINIEIPTQFNDHNLNERIIDFDALRKGMTTADAEKYNPQSKNQKFGNFAKGFAGSMLGGASGKQGSSMLNVDSVDLFLPAVLNKFFTENNVAPRLIAKWYNYDEANAENHWNDNLVIERGKWNFNEADLQAAANDQKIKNKIANTSYNMINNTFVVAMNFRFRSIQAVVQEAAALAKTAGSMFGSIGSLASTVGSTVASAAAGDGFTVQAVSHLYKLVWNNDLNNQFADEYFFKNATLDDLIKSGICKLEFVGKEKASANVRQSIFSDKPMSDLVRRATARAIDAAIAKLQSKNEVFRTVVPIIGGDGQGTIYAAIGEKEGLGSKDEYEILEAQEDENGNRSYKAIGVAKPIAGKIWNNLYGAEEEAAENAAKAEAKSKDFNDETVKLGRSEFKFKKGDYTGYFLRLKKKK